MVISKRQIIEELQKKIGTGESVIVTVAGVGLVARAEEKDDTDLVVVYNSGLYRTNSTASIAGNLPIGDADQIVYDVGKNQILPMVDHTPVIAGIYEVDPTRDMRRFLTELWNIRYRCVINSPIIGELSGPIRKELEQVDLGLTRKVGRLRLTAEFGSVTLTYCYNLEEAEILAKADIDIIVSYVDLTVGSGVGVKIAVPIGVTIRETEGILSVTKKIKPDIVTLCHSGPIVSPEDAQRVPEETCAIGFIAASSIERLPVEKGISDILKALRSVHR